MLRDIEVIESDLTGLKGNWSLRRSGGDQNGESGK